MTQAQSSEEKAQLKVQWTRLAIDQALASQWEEAVTTNRNILNIFPNDAEAYNRLGKALSELGRYSEARQAYNQTLKYSPNNTIAKKNLDRLSLLQEEPVTTPAGLERIDPRLFIEETGKTGTTDLINIAPASVLAKVGVGDKVQLYVSGHTIFARIATGEDIGQIEPRLSNRTRLTNHYGFVLAISGTTSPTRRGRSGPRWYLVRPSRRYSKPSSGLSTTLNSSKSGAEIAPASTIV